MRTFREFVNEGITDTINKLLLTLSKKIDGDNRTPKELLTQIRKLNDKALLSWYNSKTKIGDYTKLFQDAGVEREMKKRNLI